MKAVGEGVERVDAVWRHPLYQESLKKIETWEADREFCRHTPEHFLAVARLTWILALEAGLPAKKDVVYAAAFLHDIGRWRQYEEGVPHEQASAELAEEILKDCESFSKEETAEILHLIRAHRRQQEEGEVAALFYRADKLSRNCFACPAREACDWPEEKKNLRIRD